MIVLADSRVLIVLADSRVLIVLADSRVRISPVVLELYCEMRIAAMCHIHCNFSWLRIAAFAVISWLSFEAADSRIRNVHICGWLHLQWSYFRFVAAVSCTSLVFIVQSFVVVHTELLSFSRAIAVAHAAFL